ncbi:hypothetical protein Tco_0636850 [Tanacetum coccineum]
MLPFRCVVLILGVLQIPSFLLNFLSFFLRRICLTSNPSKTNSLLSTWEHGQQRPAIFVGGKEMPFRNFIYTEDDEDLTFLPMDFSPGFNTSSPSVSINTEPVRTDEEPAVEPVTEPVNERVGTTADSGGSPKGDTFVVHVRSVAASIRERKCKTRGGSLRPPVKRKLASRSSTSRIVRAKASAMKDDTPVLSIFDDDEGLEYCLELKDAIACHLKISAITPPAWKGFLDNHPDVDLLNLHDRCYARELAREEECEGLQAKCEAAMTDFDKNPVVLLL